MLATLKEIKLKKLRQTYLTVKALYQSVSEAYAYAVAQAAAEDDAAANEYTLSSFGDYNDRATAV